MTGGVETARRRFNCQTFARLSGNLVTVVGEIHIIRKTMVRCIEKNVDPARTKICVGEGVHKIIR
jgi:hypothetical protein